MKDHPDTSSHPSEALSAASSARLESHDDDRAAGDLALRAPSPMREPTTLHEILDSMDPSDPLSSVSSFPQEAAYEDELPSETTSTGRRRRHILSEQRRRNQSREAFERLSELLAVGRQYGARALGLNAGAGTGVEDEELDDRTDTEEDLMLCCDEEVVMRRKRNALRRARTRLSHGRHVRGKGRGRGGSAGQAGSKSAVLFQVIDLLDWLDGREAQLERDIRELEMRLGASQRPRFG